MSNVIPRKKPVSRKVPGLLQLYVELAWIKPKVWRRIVVAESITLAKLHQVLQTAFDWENCYLHEFNIGGERFGIPDPEFGWEPVRSEKRIQLKTALGTLRSFRYIYDFGDHWEHQIKVEKRLPGDPERTHRVTCLAGANAAPPEDVGGARATNISWPPLPTPIIPSTSKCSNGMAARLIPPVSTTRPSTVSCLASVPECQGDNTIAPALSFSPSSSPRKPPL